MVGIVDGAVVTLNIGHQVVVEVEAEHISSELRARCAEHAFRRCGQQFIGVAVGQHHDHLLSLTLCEQVVEDIVHTTDLVIHLLGIGGTADEVEHGIALLGVLGIARGQTDHGLIGGTETLGVIVDIVDVAVGHILDVVGQGAVTGRDLQQTVLKTLVGEILLTGGIHDAHAIDDEAIGIHIGGSRTEGGGPETGLGIALHGVTPGELYINEHLLGLVVAVTEGHRAVGIAGGGGVGGELPPVEAHVTTHLTEAEVEVMDAISTVDLCGEGLIGVEVSGVGKTDGADDRTLTTVETQGDGALALGGCRDAEALGTQTEIDAAQTDKLTVVDMIDIHVTLTGRGGHVGHDPRVGDAHLRRLETEAPGHRLCLYTLVGIEGVELCHGLLVEPVGHLFDGAVRTVGDLRGRDTATLMVDEGLQVHQVVVLSEDIGVTFIVRDTRVVTAVALGGAHDVAFRYPRSCGGIAHGIAESLRTAGRGVCEIVVATAFVEPGTFLVVVHCPFGFVTPWHVKVDSGSLLLHWTHHAVYGVEYQDVALGRDHVIVQFYAVGIGVAPVHIGLSVVVNPHGGIDVVPVALIPHQRLAEGILEGSVG